MFPGHCPYTLIPLKELNKRKKKFETRNPTLMITYNIARMWQFRHKIQPSIHYFTSKHD